MIQANRFFYLVLLSLIFAMSATQTFAQTEKAKVEVKLNADFAMSDTLKTFKGTKKRVSLLLSNGVSYTGLVSDVGSHFVVLSQLGGGKDFFDALIQLEQISALEVQVR
ncbi:MAG: hypothetical protein A2X86_16770 [Bdellovibrionales bacterium GWA2_49_15]|nr:MAG: hypothetical protein A2X86_16770 [Bdellovibrionales bacterium GWA2_49_15]HAZ12472.1 hypothetical protein [Bdellovibrionales bacterium]